MSQLDYPVLKHSGGEWWPDSCSIQEWGGRSPFNVCPVCGSGVAGWRNKAGVSSHYSTDGGIVLASIKAPLIVYHCGGVFRELPENPDFWSGKCPRRRLLRQKLMDWFEYV